jgi:hypothetical protein
VEDCVDAERKKGKIVMGIVIGLVAVVCFGLFGGFGLMNELRIKSDVCKHLEEKYGEKFVVLDFSVDKGIPFIPDDSYDLACAPESNRELIFSVFTVDSEKVAPRDKYIERLAAEDCEKLIRPTLDKIASNYAIETNAYFSTDDIDVHSGWKEFATAEYAVRSQGEISSFIFIDKSSMKGLDYGKEYDLLTEMIDHTFPTEFSLSIWFTYSGIVKECDEYIVHNLPSWNGYENILGEEALTDVSIDRNGYRETDTTREEYINERGQSPNIQELGG